MSSRKKTRKPNVSSQALERARRELYGEPTPTENEVEDAVAEQKVEVVAKKVVNTRRAVTIEDLKAEYGHVIADLTSMGTLSGILFVAMIVVSLLLDQVL